MIGELFFLFKALRSSVSSSIASVAFDKGAEMRRQHPTFASPQRNPKKSCMQCRTACGPKRAAVYLPETKDTSTRLRQEGQATTVNMTGLMASTELLCVKLAEARACCSSAKDNKDVGSLNTCPAIFQCYHLSTPKHPKHLVSCNGYFMLFL